MTASSPDGPLEALPRVLFVDDDERVLRGLVRMLSNYTDEWRVESAVGAEAALELLEAESFDVVVTDMRMPHMNGNEFLRCVRESYPEMGRIILSGHADEALYEESRTIAHRYLSKPCNAETLLSTIQLCLRELPEAEPG